jgi:hypothetical protein
MPLFYQSGEEIKKGDRVIFHGEPGEIEFVADPASPDSETDWYIKEYGGGIMVLEPKHFGRAFLPTPTESNLWFVSRSEANSAGP